MSGGSRLYPCENPECYNLVHPDGAYEGSYCTPECEAIHSTRQAGADLLEAIRHDHRFCFNCFRRTKEIAKPDPSAPDCVVGYQYLTEHAELGHHERDVRDDPVIQTERTAPADRVVKGATECECGTVDHRDDYLRSEHVSSIRDAAERLVGILDVMRQEGQHDKRIDARTLVRALTETAREDGTPDWALAVGRAIVDDH